MNEPNESDQRQLREISGQVVLAGAGVVGRTIAEAMLSRGINVFLADVSRDNLDSAITWLTDREEYVASPILESPTLGSFVHLSGERSEKVDAPKLEPRQPGLVIESIVERLDIKKAFFAQVSQYLGENFMITSNTSSLRLQDLADSCHHPQRFCGLHFFMPIKGRDLVEVVRTRDTSDCTLQNVSAFSHVLGKQALVVRDSPSLVVNRMLTPYINQGLRLLEMGANHAIIEQTSKSFGMPRSPLEMVDMIGSRTAFNAGRVAWQTFPHRVEPSPILPGLIKKGLAGWASGCGFYNYDLTSDPPQPSSKINETAAEVIERYQHSTREWTAVQIRNALAIPMWIEAGCILSEQVTNSLDSIELAMRGGLGYEGTHGFFGFFDRLGNAALVEAIESCRHSMKAMVAPDALFDALKVTATASEAIKLFVVQTIGSP